MQWRCDRKGLFQFWVCDELCGYDGEVSDTTHAIITPYLSLTPPPFPPAPRQPTYYQARIVKSPKLKYVLHHSHCQTSLAAGFLLMTKSHYLRVFSPDRKGATSTGPSLGEEQKILAWRPRVRAVSAKASVAVSN